MFDQLKEMQDIILRPDAPHFPNIDVDDFIGLEIESAGIAFKFQVDPTAIVTKHLSFDYIRKAVLEVEIDELEAACYKEQCHSVTLPLGSIARSKSIDTASRLRDIIVELKAKR